MIGLEQRFHPDYSAFVRAYIALFGVPVVGLRIRARNVLKLLPDDLHPRRILDAGCGPGVISFALCRRFPGATVTGVDLGAREVEACRSIAERAGVTHAVFETADVRALRWRDHFDLVVCVDILEHIEDDAGALSSLARALAPGGTLVLHVPSRYRRYPLFARRVNFDVPSHVRPGYERSEIVAKARGAGLVVADSGHSYGFLETLANNVSYMITRARKRNPRLYALAFPWLNLVGWLGRHARPARLGAGVFLVCRKPGECPS